MSDENKFFRWIWRFNALLILVAVGTVLVLVIGRAVKPDFDPLHLGPPTTERIFETLRKARPAENATLEAIQLGFDAAPSERLYALNKPLAAGDYDPQNLFLAGNRTANILALDPKAKTTRWLFDDKARVILSTTVLSRIVPGSKSEPDQDVSTRICGLVMVIVDADTNRDGKLNADDRQTLYYYALDGKAPVKWLTADRIFRSEETEQAGQYHMFYQDGPSTYAVTFSLPDFHLISKIAIKKMPKLNATVGPGVSTESVVVTGMR